MGTTLRAIGHILIATAPWLLGTATAQRTLTDTDSRAGSGFRLERTAPLDRDDYFTRAVVVASTRHGLISRNHTFAGSSEHLDWMNQHRDRIGTRLFRMDADALTITPVPDSTHFGFVPDRDLAYVSVSCSGKVHLFDTRSHEAVASFEHVLPEGSGPNPAVSPNGNLLATQTAESLRIWELATMTSLTPGVEHGGWSFRLEFSGDGRWLLTQKQSNLHVRDPRSARVVAGPFRHDLLEGPFAFSGSSDRLATCENGPETDDAWSHQIVVRRTTDWEPTRRMRLPGHARTVRWVGDQTLIVITDTKRPGQRPPISYGKKAVQVVSLERETHEVRTLMRTPWLFDAAVSPDGDHVLTTARDATSCWRLADGRMLWQVPGRHSVSFGPEGWALLQSEDRAAAHSLASGERLGSWNDVVVARVEGPIVWICTTTAIERWRAAE